MGLFFKALFGVIVAGIIYGYIQINKVPEIPVFEEVWWGKGDSSKEDTSIKPFKVDVSPEVSSLTDIKCGNSTLGSKEKTKLLAAGAAIEVMRLCQLRSCSKAMLTRSNDSFSRGLGVIVAGFFARQGAELGFRGVELNKILNDLKQRLDRALPFHPPLEGVNQHYGMNTKLLTKVVDYWKNTYNWTERQTFLNQYPQYTTSIQGLRIHYIHVKPKVEQSSGIKVVPLLLLHGWPGSVREFYEIIPLLTEPQKGRKVLFEVIIPSLPGYGFSEATNKPGLSPSRMAQIFKNLMKRLRFEKFYVQGGDWGALITKYMSTLYPQNVLGAHSNMCASLKATSNLKLWLLGSIYPPLVATEEEIPLVFPLAEKTLKNVMLLEMGYMHLQATKPDTIGVALRDSPVGLAAYLLEKFTTWTNPAWKDLEDGGLTKKFTMDQLLDNVMIYWVTRSITTSMRLYSEMFNKANMGLNLDDVPTSVPTACARFKKEISISPESVLRESYLNLIQVTLHQDGGHFAAFELPQVLANDLYDFIEKII